MNILTKISVVVLVLLVVAFCPVLISQATTQANYRELFESRKAQIDSQSAQLRLDEVALQSALMRIRKETDRAQAADNKLAEDVAKLTGDLTAERTKVAAQSAELAGMGQTLKKFEEDIKAWQARNEKLVTDLAAANEKIVGRDKDISRLTDEVNRKTIEAERYQRHAEFLQEQVAQLDEALKDLREKWSKVGPVARGTNEPAGPVGGGTVDIIGTVTAVKGDIASINIGSTKGVKKGMNAIVSRGSKFVCEIQIDSVDQGQAAGVISKRNQDPEQGDKIVIPAGGSK